MFDEAQKAALSTPLDRKHVSQRNQAGRNLSYIEGWHAIAEANRIFGFDGWSRETVENKMLHEPEHRDGKWWVSYSAKVRVTVGTIVREGCGFGSGIDRDLGRAHESALKESETDSLKRALMTFGWPFGLALYDKTQEHVSDGQGHSNGRGGPAPNMVPPDIDLGHLKGEGPSRFASKSPYDKLKTEMMANRDLDDLNQWWVESKATRNKQLNSEYGMFLFREMLKHGFDIAPGPEDMRMFLVTHGKELTALKERSLKEWEGIGDYYEHAKAKHAAPVR